MATLVARGVTPSEVFSAVAEELARCLGLYHHAVLWRYEPDGAATLLAAGDDDPGLKKMPVGERFSLEGESVAAMVLRTGRAARMDSYENASGSVAARFRDLGLRAAVGAPIVVDGRLWGAAIVGSSRPEPLPPDTEARVGDFTDLVATAIANAQAHAELTASRARIVAAADDARRRFERDLHDGAQQRLVSLGLELRTAEASVPPELHPLREQISDIVDGLVGVSDGATRDLTRDSSRRSCPREDSVQRSRRWPAARRCRSSSTSPSTDGCRSPPKWPPTTSSPKHSRTPPSTHERRRSTCASKPRTPTSTSRFATTESAEPTSAKGSGLTGLIDRVEALGGKMAISSHPGSGTSLHVKIPFECESITAGGEPDVQAPQVGLQACILDRDEI